ncbi:hypothetical protein A1O3_06444 [Capronia epimyces CBS 606.96]|uniref:Uncharacterized protein n=1 Tax=Capronia epimyces CBS 606.96 TaxID=1182542 RepID=W9Y056_9EURO|nr:uncharacterized protein A1O3_06444 [Capronia epimyces CBS 606.96]EXJ82631.1 hypothetical protein A1O3_06444 [Capronia epimyces CBS 606.96]
MANPLRYPVWIAAKGRCLLGNIGMIRPPRTFFVPLAFAKKIRATALPVDRYQAESRPAEGDPDIDCGAPFCSAASHTMAKPLTYPFWMFVRVWTLFGSDQARALSPADGPIAHVNGLVPKHLTAPVSSAKSEARSVRRSSHSGSSGERKEDASAATLGHAAAQHIPISTSLSEHGPDASAPDLPPGLSPPEFNNSEKVGGYAPIQRGPSNSSAPHGHLIPFTLIYRAAMLPMKALGWPVSPNPLVPRMGAFSLEHECGNADVDGGETLVDGKNAHESLGLGSALMRIWEGARDSMV